MKPTSPMLHCALISAERSFYNGSARFVAVTGCEGELGIAAGHAPLLSALPPGHVRIEDAFGKTHLFFVEGGYVEVQPHQVNILADTVLRAEEIDLAEAERARQHALAHLAKGRTDFDYPRAAHELLEARARIEVVQMARKRRQGRRNKV